MVRNESTTFHMVPSYWPKWSLRKIELRLGSTMILGHWQCGVVMNDPTVLDRVGKFELLTIDCVRDLWLPMH